MPQILVEECEIVVRYYGHGFIDLDWKGLVSLF